MSNPFTDLQQALANLGIDYAIAGIMLGAVLTVALLIMLMWILAPKGKGDSTIFMISAGIGIIISTAVGWFPLWIVVFIAFILVFILIDPLGSARGGSD